LIKIDDNLLLRLDHAGIYRDQRWLVHGVDLEIRRGEIITLIGPNGSGKSTTAKMALRILRPTHGTVWQKTGLKIGYVPQKITIDKALPLSVTRLMRLTTKLPLANIDAALDEVGVAHLGSAQVATLSGGELQRVLLARAAAGKPDLMVLDEPLQGVDFAGEAALYELISHYRDRLNCGILMISHDLHIVMAASDQVLCLDGHVCCRGKPEEVVKSAEYIALFASRHQNMFALYNHHHHSTTNNFMMNHANKLKETTDA